MKLLTMVMVFENQKLVIDNHRDAGILIIREMVMNNQERNGYVEFRKTVNCGQ